MFYFLIFFQKQTRQINMKWNKSWAVIILLLCFFEQSVAQDQVPAQSNTKPKKVFEEYYIGEYRFKTRNNWVLFGFGPNVKPSLPNFTNANMELSFNYYDRLDRLWQLSYQASTLNYLAFGGATVYLNSFNVGRGKVIEKQYYKIAAFAGPSLVYTNYYPNDSTKTINQDKTFGLGIQGQLQFIIKPVYDFGISISPFVNINTVQSVAGITLSIYGSNAMERKINY